MRRSKELLSVPESLLAEAGEDHPIAEADAIREIAKRMEPTAVLEVGDSDRRLVDDLLADLPGATAVALALGRTPLLDLSEFTARIDLVIVQPSDQLSEARERTATALRVVRPSGAILWLAYAESAVVRTHLRQLATVLEPAPVRVGKTSLVIHAPEIVNGAF